MKKGIILLAALTAVGTARATIFTVHVYDFDFSTVVGDEAIDPTISLGDTVRWVWDTSRHTATSSAGQSESWNSGLLNAGGQFDHTFTHLGTFNYFCSVHGFDAGGGQAGGMSGQVHVIAAPEPASMAFLGLGALALIRRRKA